MPPGMPPLPALYPILDACWLPAPGAGRQAWLCGVVSGLAEAGVGILQYRNKDGDDAQCVADASTLAVANHGHGLTLILNDRVHLLGETGFDGVHVGQGDMAAAEARAHMGPGKILGVSTHTLAQVQAADAAPVDYVAYGPVYATASKADAEPVVGLEGLRQARALTAKPLVAIGGVSPERAAAVLAAGADLVATISGVFRRGDTPEGAQNLAGDFLSHFRYNTM